MKKSIFKATTNMIIVSGAMFGLDQKSRNKKQKSHGIFTIVRGTIVMAGANSCHFCILGR